MDKKRSARQKINYKRGALFALGGPLVGIIAWVIVWQVGFIASIVAFLMAWLTIKLFRLGAGGIDRKSLNIVLPYIVAGLLLAILASMADDAAHFVMKQNELAGFSDFWFVITKPDFWDFWFYNLTHNSLVWKDFIGSILASLALAALGTYSTIKSLFITENAQS